MRKQIHGMGYRSQLEVPPELPSNLLGTAGLRSVRVPNVYEEYTEPAEYYVKTLSSLNAMELEEELNDAGRDGWQLFLIIRQEEQVLLVFRRLLGRKQ